MSEFRHVYAPPRAADCELEFLPLKVGEAALGEKYQVLGHIYLEQEGVQDPLQPSYRAKVRPWACALGGEAVAVLTSWTDAPWALSAGATRIDYLIVRKQPVATPPAAPQKF